MSDDISIENYEVVNNLLLVTFTDSTEAVINIKQLRQKCPCAACEGEAPTSSAGLRGADGRRRSGSSSDAPGRASPACRGAAAAAALCLAMVYYLLFLQVLR